MKRYLSDDPAFVLDDNPYCEDCLRFRGLINAERLNKERFRLHVRLPYYAGMDLKRFMQLTKVLGLQGSRLIIRKLLLIMKLIKFSTQRMNIGLISRYYELFITIELVFNSFNAAKAFNTGMIHCTIPRLEMCESELKSSLKKQ